MNMKKNIISLLLLSATTLSSAQTDKAVSANTANNQMRIVLQNGTSKYYNTADVEKVQIDESNVIVDGYTNEKVNSITFKKGVNVTNAEVNILKSEGWLNSAYIVFEQIEGATYKVLCDDKAIDQQLIRYYDSYTYYEPSEDENLQVTWEKKTLSNVVRADVLGLKAGEHTLKVCAVSGTTESDYSSVTLDVADHDRSGFAFTGSTTPGAYNADGTLKANTLVIYLTQDNKQTLIATIGGSQYTGIQNITQAIKTKNTGTTPIDIRIVGAVKAESNDLSCSDMKSAYALGVKEAQYVTIEGVGHDATLVGAGVAAFKSDYVEIANLGLVKWGGGKDGDGVSLKEDSYAWVHHCDFFYGDAGSDADQVKGDGSMDLKDDANHITIAYNHFWDSGKMSLCGMKSESGPNYITYHHNWFDHSDSRHPRIRTMTVHVYNNYFDGNAKYGVGVTTGASCFVEGNFFRNAHDPMMSSKQGTDAQGSGTFSGEEGGVIKSWNNTFVQNNTNGVKFQFITNKYDYTNNKELGEYKEWTETIGTDNGDGSWTIYDSKVSDTENTIASNSLIAIEDATLKGAYYQISKGKTGFYIDVPANVTKVVVRAKCGSSGKTGTADMLSVDGNKVEIDMSADYTDYEVALSKTADCTIEIANAHSGNSMNVKEIKVLASSGWETVLTSGADVTNIDAYEVDNRSEKVPNEVKTKSGSNTYNNFDTTLGDDGLGLNNLPTSPAEAKADIIELSGRHTPDIAWNFTNSTDDASYAVNTQLNTMLVSYTTSMTKIQGETTTDSDSSSDDDNGDDNTSDDNTSDTPSASGAATISFSKTEASDDRVTYSTTKQYSTAQTYNEVEYSYGAKLNSTGTLTLTLEASYTVTFVLGTDKPGYSKGLTIDGTVVAPTNNVVTTTLSAGEHTITNGGSETSVFLVILSE